MRLVKILAVMLAMVIMLSACSTASVTEKNDSSVNEGITVTDQVGREVVIEKTPESIVSAYYISTSMVIALGLEAKLVGIENGADKRPLYALSADRLLTLPSVGTVKDFNLEECAALNPDLVILPTKLKDMVEPLEELGITVIVVNPESLELLEESIRLIATATDTSERAEKIISEMENEISNLASLLENAEKPSVYFSGNSSFLRTSGKNMYQNTLIENTGAVNVAGELDDTYWAEISYEQVLAWNPEYIIMASDAQYSVEDVLNDENLSEVTAVVNGNVYQVPSFAEPLDSPVPASVFGSSFIASFIHPDLYSNETALNAIGSFYETFYDYKPEF